MHLPLNVIFVQGEGALCVVRGQHTTAAHVMSSLVVQSLVYVVQALDVTALCNTLVRA